MMRFSPYDLGIFGFGYARGWIASKQRAGMDPIILEGYGMGGGFTPPAPPFTQEAREKYRLKVEPIAGCGVDQYILGHAQGYNTASLSEIKRRYGSGVIAAAEREEMERQVRFLSDHARGTADAENDARNSQLAILIYQHARDEDAWRGMFQARYQTQLRRVAKSRQELSETELSYVWGYNEAAGRELARRFGDEGQSAAWLVGTVPFADYLARAESRGHSPPPR